MVSRTASRTLLHAILHDEPDCRMLIGFGEHSPGRPRWSDAGACDSVPWQEELTRVQA